MKYRVPGFKLTEEIARWAFELECTQRGFFEIAFTNPTAGPWKRVTASAVNGEIGEVMRFGRNDRRPDIVVYSDTNRVVYIIEAKPELSALLRPDQVEKTIKTYGELARLLQGTERNDFWGQRNEYKFGLGLLWGSMAATSDQLVRQLVQIHRAAAATHSIALSMPVLCIESLYDRADNSIKCIYSRSGANGSFVKSSGPLARE